MILTLLLFTSALVIGLLGAAHLMLTLVGPKLLPRDRSLQASMEAISPVITTQTTMWRAWLGFNFSHSLGAILFGLVYGYLSIAPEPLLFQSLFLQLVGLGMLVGYVVLAWFYWFITPLAGTFLSLVCYLVGLLLWWTS